MRVFVCCSRAVFVWRSVRPTHVHIPIVFVDRRTYESINVLLPLPGSSRASLGSK